MTFNQAPPDYDWLNQAHKQAGNIKPPEPPEPRWTKADYQRLRHLWRLEAFLLWRHEAERVPAIKRAIGHQINLIRSEMDDYHPRLRYFVARERDTMLRSRPLRNAIGTVQSHSANPYRKNPHHFLQLRYYKSGKHDVFPEYVEGTQS